MGGGGGVGQRGHHGGGGNYGDRIPSSGSGGRGRGINGDKRKKRFYGLQEVGCVKGVVCCEVPQCRPYCSLCNDYDGRSSMKVFIVFILEFAEKIN